MGPFLQFRLWVKEASKIEVGFSAVIATVVVSLVAWAMAPVGRSGTELSAADDAGFGVDASGSGGDEAGGDGAVESGGGTGATSDSTGVAAGPNVSRGGGGAGARSGNAGAAGAGGGGSGGGSGGGTTDVKRVASDRGVSPDAIKVGFNIANLNGFAAAGLAATNVLRDDMPQVIDAWVDDVNKNGGINGRKIVPIKKSVDLVNASDQRAKCLEHTESDQVFSVIDSVSASYKASMACYTVEHKTPLVNSVTYGDAFLKQGLPYHVSPSPHLNQQFKDAVFAAKDAGFFDVTKGFVKLGILTDDCDTEANDDPKIGFVAYLRQAGVTPDKISEFRLSCDLVQQQRQVAQAVLQHKGDGVTHVLPAVAWPAVQTYLQNADSQLFKPKYRPGISQLIHDGNQAGFSANQWDGTQGVVVARVGEQVVGKPISPLAQHCSKVIQQKGLKPMDDYQSFNAEAVLICENFYLWVKIARAAGPNPTRLSWGQAAQSTGQFDGAFLFKALYNRPGKTSGGDEIATVEWRAACRCWHQVAGFRPGY